MGFRRSATALGIEAGDVGADSRKVGLELGGDFCAVLGENCVGKVGERHFGRNAANHLWLCESCGVHHSNDAEREQSRARRRFERDSRSPATAPGTRKTVSVSWAFLNVLASLPGSIFPADSHCGGGVDPTVQPGTRRRIHPSFIVFVIFMLIAPYFLLGIASQRNLRYNVPNR